MMFFFSTYNLKVLVGSTPFVVPAVPYYALNNFAHHFNREMISIRPFLRLNESLCSILRCLDYVT
jgi:hypothetical protein